MGPETPPTIGLSKIGQIGVRARDLDRAVAFYRDTLGMRFLFRVPEIALFDCAGVRLMLSAPERSDLDHPGSIIYYQVEDLPTFYTTLSQRGVAFDDAPHLIARMPDHDLWMAFFKDSEGNTVGLMSEVPHAGSGH